MHEDTTAAGNGPTWQETLADTPAGTEPVMFDVAVAPVRRGGNGALRVGIVAGVAALVVLGTAITMAASPVGAAPRGLVAVASAAPTENPSASPGPGDAGRRGRGMMGGPGMMGPGMVGGNGGAPGNGWTFIGGRGMGGPGGGHVGAISIASLSGSSVSLKTTDGWTRTITLTDATTITKAGKTVKASDLAVDDTIRFSETRNSDGTYTITAVDVILPTVTGQVTATSSSSITMTGRDGSTITVHVDSSTTYAVDGKTGLALSDIKSGMVLVAEGTTRSDGSLDASRVQAESFAGGGGRGRGNWNNGASPAPTKAPGSSG